MEETICILDVDYLVEEGRPVIRIWGKTSDGRNVIVLDRSLQPYFYAEAAGDISARLGELQVDGKSAGGVEHVERRLYGEKKKLVKISVILPSDVPRFKDAVTSWRDVRQCYEYGISFYRRYLINTGFVPMGWVRLIGKEREASGFGILLEAESIETVKREGYPRLAILAFDIEMVQEDGKERIIMISLADTTGFRRVLTYKGNAGIENMEILDSEEGMLKRFLELVAEQDPDIITGYNTDSFDFAKLSEKCREYGISMSFGRSGEEGLFIKRGGRNCFYIRDRINVDLYVFIETILGASLATEVLTLDRVSRELIGRGKREVKWKEIEAAWKAGDMGFIADYCMQDSELALGLAESILPQMFELCRVTGQTLFDSSRMTYSQLVEWLLIRKAHEIGEVIPNRPRYDEVERRRKAPAYAGGYVHQPKEGIHDGIALFDFASLYPSIIITHNISPDTLDCRCCRRDAKRVPGQGHYYCTKNRGFVARVLEEIVTQRHEVAREMKQLDKASSRYKSLHSRQYVLKILANASYGYYGYAASRWYSRVCAESITLWGRFYIKDVIGLAEEMGLGVIYGDTDSLFLKIASDEDAKVFLQKANGSLPGIMELDFRDIYRSGIFVLTKAGTAAKKRYALIDYSGNIVIKGFERVRRDWAPIAKSMQESVLYAVLRDRSPQRAVEVVQEQVRLLRSGTVSLDDLVIYTQITRPLHLYEQIGPHVAAARKMIERGKIIKKGHTIGYVITKGVGSISQRAEPAEDAENYDPEYYINNQVIPAAMRVLGGLGYTEQDMVEDQRQASLKGFLEEQ